jgi:hypothetical protein
MKTLFYYTVVAIVIAFAQSAFAIPVTVGFANGASSGGIYSVDVIVSGIPAGGAVAAYDLDVSYNASRLTATGIDFKYGLGIADIDTARQGAVWSTSGVFDLWSLSLYNDTDLLNWQSGADGFIDQGTLTLATLYFNDSGAGNHGLAFNWYEGQDIKGLNNEIIAGYVAEPCTLFLLGVGLAALGSLRCRSNILKRLLVSGRQPVSFSDVVPH